mmetsp:Transcript_40865/g.91687  ORF Transcript_40865/g.91687 Transcript_40865/m.91687 type:complete len:292 (+) Transcript_40865:279-1154(+)
MGQMSGGLALAASGCEGAKSRTEGCSRLSACSMVRISSTSTATCDVGGSLGIAFSCACRCLTRVSSSLISRNLEALVCKSRHCPFGLCSRNWAQYLRQHTTSKPPMTTKRTNLAPNSSKLLSGFSQDTGLLMQPKPLESTACISSDVDQHKTKAISSVVSHEACTEFTPIATALGMKTCLRGYSLSCTCRMLLLWSMYHKTTYPPLDIIETGTPLPRELLSPSPRLASLRYPSESDATRKLPRDENAFNPVHLRSPLKSPVESVDNSNAGPACLALTRSSATAGPKPRARL